MCESTGLDIWPCRTLAAHITTLNIASGPGSAQRETPVPAGNPVNTRRPDGMSYGPRSTPDTPFTDHSGEPLPARPLHLPLHCKHIVCVRQLPAAKRLDNESFVNRRLLVYLSPLHP